MKAGEIFRDASRPRGTAMMMAIEVPQIAIWTVSHICET